MYNLRKLLKARGVHYLLTRFGTSHLRRLSFDQKFLDGEWNFSEAPSSELVAVVEKYASGGHILMLGCGSGAIAQSLNPERFTSFLGVDISPTAIALALRGATNKIRFETGNMLHYQPALPCTVILLSESLYYVPPLRRKTFLSKLASNLAPEGRIVVTISESDRFARLLAMIRRAFEVDEDRLITPGKRHLIVFH
jgi:trans-aconitate methyltransferase